VKTYNANKSTLLCVYSSDADMNGVSGCNGISVKVTLGSEIVPTPLDTGAVVSIIPEAHTEYSLQT